MPGNGPWKGKPDANLMKAIENAWDAAKADGMPSGSMLVIDEISFTGVNPITEYSVKIKKP